MWDEVIQNQVRPFEQARITRELVLSTFHQISDSLLIQIRNGQIFEVQKGSHRIDEGRTRGMLALVEDVFAQFDIPDIYFILSLADKPISDMAVNFQPEIPVFCFCKSEDKNCFMFPFARFAHDDVGMRYCNIPTATRKTWRDNLFEIAATNQRFPWEEKVEKTVYSGHTISHDGSRIRLHQLSAQHPELIDSFVSSVAPEHTHLFQEERMRQKIGTTIDMQDYPRYKYLLYLDGNSASDRLRYLLAFNSTLIKSESPYQEFYTPLLKAGQHYVSINPDLSNLVEVLTTLREHDDLARMIAAEGMEFVIRHLTYPDVLEYTRRILFAYRDLCVF